MNYIVLGKSCSGKSTVRNYCADKLHTLYSFEASAVIKNAKKQYNTDSMDKLFELHGKNFVAEKLLTKLNDEHPFIISGFRTIEEIEKIKQEYPVNIISLVVPDEICFQRAISRKRNDAPLTFTDFYINKICADYSLGLAKAISKHTDIPLQNSGK
jgi:dephospho-CoA kinase